MRSFSKLLKVTAGLAVISLPNIAISAPTDGVFKHGVPFGLQDLPPGRTRNQIENLPLPAQERALEWLNSFSFHKSDLPFINVDTEGGVFYQDTFSPESTDPVSSGADTPVLEAAANVFALHSKPGASKVFILDFDGHTFSGTAWGGGASYSATPFDTDGNFNNVSEAEKNAIHEIWHRIAEDFAPFDIDITTEEPATLTSTTGRLLITRNSDTTGKTMPYETAGGVAYVGVWGRSNFASYYSPALVYYNNLSSYAPYIAEAASHEAGHNFNLGHDGTSTTGYYGGHGPGYVSWAPVMGVGYYQNVTQWSKGEYSGATQTQDDISILSSQLSYRSDDHAANTTSATELLIAGDGSIGVSNPETDPGNTVTGNKGIIETRSDIDTFTFVSGSGTIDISAIPAWDAFSRSSRRGANLDIELTLLDDSGVISTSDPSDNTNARIVETLPAGRYYLEVTGVGNSTSPYSDYGSLGQYFITGTVPPSNVSSDTTPPNPDPMGWSVAPYTAGSSSIAMTALTASDDSGVVEYQFTCVAGANGCTSSAWQSSTSYLATGLSENTSYSYQVAARDLYNNVTTASAMATATTASNNPPSAGNDSASGNEDEGITINALANDGDPDGDTLTISSVGSASNGSTSTNGSAITYTPNVDFNGSDSFSYTVSDGSGATASATVNVTVDPINDAPTAVNDSASVATNSTVTIDVLANDSDKEDSPLTLVSVGSANKGSVSIVGSSVSYTAGKKRGNDTVSYIVSDGDKQSTASISISIGGSGGGGSTDGGGKCHPKRGC
ncbi:MAG: tandem-95 repeat protein [Gammaproteobacteria bacterium]|nr:tandem-95 repeat protein [Gammaproteobacteria bacterium]MBQ0839562.1 tandem-95 repeat protein [Gammaproteobacteria bacterium]